MDVKEEEEEDWLAARGKSNDRASALRSQSESCGMAGQCESLACCSGRQTGVSLRKGNASMRPSWPSQRVGAPEHWNSALRSFRR